MAQAMLILSLFEPNVAAQDLNGSLENPATSCREIAVRRPGAINGVYYLKATGVRNEPFPVYCDINSGGRAADLWTKIGTVNENELSALNSNNVFKGHYKNMIVDKWTQFGHQEVAVVLYNGGQEMIRLLFNARHSSKSSWFSKYRLNSSPFSDITTRSHNFFSIHGNNRNRNFFINHAYEQCEGDSGWLAVISGKDETCSWSKGYFIRIRYAHRNTMVDWSTPNKVEDADVFAVFVR
jgi:hypothetical protein